MLCTLALEDESTLSLPLPDHIYGFCAQQACEKLMKALIASRGTPYPFTHKLDLLLDILTSVSESIPTTPYLLDDLTQFAVKFRYDLAPPMPSVDRDAIRDTVAIVREHVLARILALESAIPAP